MNAGRTINELLRGAILAAAVGLQAGTIARADPVSAARGVLERVVGTDMAARIVLESISQVDGRDVYEYSAADGTLTCPETGLRYRAEGARLRCLDLDEDSPLPEKWTQGSKFYDEFRGETPG